ncbi:uncharacterized protein LOC126376807 [Pectinophora gossypiella]|uniref:uncharacterized protein LOC126376807 n=1 Tax=Pectinophora gossypiella TaxID=13191 RepID=UPI00214EB9DB|nr:uncharacterized protein LOC126376807 [Pectinophora gossypiella]
MNKQIGNSSPPAGIPSERPRPSSEGKPHSYTAGGKDCFVGQQDAGLREHDQGFENGSDLGLSSNVREMRSGRKMERVPGRLERETRVSLSRLPIGRDALVVLPGPSGKVATSDGEDTEGSIVSMRSAVSVGSGVTRATKRARLPGTATNGGSPKSKRKSRPRPRPEIVIDDNDPYLSSVSVSSTRSKDTLPSVEDLAMEMKEQPVADLGARILESMETVTKVADHSKNLKGNFVRCLRLAAITAKAAAGEMAQRTSSFGSEGWLERENASLRSKLSGMEERLKTLQAEMESLRQRERAPPRPEVRRQPAKGADEILMDRIGALVENKLAAFKAELLPGRAIRPPLGKRPVTSDAPAAPSPAQPPKPSRGSDEILMEVRRPIPRTAPVASAVAPTPAAPKKKKKKKKFKKKGERGTNLQPPPAPKGAPAVAMAVAGPSGLQTRSWAQVVRKKPASRPSETATASKPKPAKTQKPAQQARGTKATPARPPTTAVVTVTVPEGAATTYAAVMGAAKQRVNLAECGITELRQRRAATGGLILQVPGPDSAKKADELAARLRSTLADMDVHILRPVKTGEIRVADFDESVTPADIASAIADQGGCSQDDVKVGEIRLSSRKMGTAWVRCPLAAIRKLANTARLKVGWASARVQVLTARPLQCYKCLEMGHCNLNHCRAAQDLLLQTLAEWSIALTVVAEPFRVPDHPRWFPGDGGSVAIHWGGGRSDPPCSLLCSGQGFVAVEWGHLAVVGCYISPNCRLEAFESYLDSVANCIRSCRPRPVLVLGDFNAHARQWGCARDTPRGETLQEWADGLDLRLLNQGSVSTCVRWQGESVVDLSWATPAAARLVSGWRVAEELVTLSDHRHIVIEVSIRPPERSQRDEGLPRRWSLKQLDPDLFVAAANVALWPEEGIFRDPEQEASWFRSTMTSICDASMPRVRALNRKRVYWWSEECAQLRTTCLRARRRYTRTRRRRRATSEEVDEAYASYRAATKAFQYAVSDAKARAWHELLDDLSRDPWGRPYKIVLGKLRPWVPPLTETMDSALLETVIDALFPRVQNGTLAASTSAEPTDWSPQLEVSQDELDRAVKRLRAKNTAPGPDGIPGRAWVLALTVLRDRLRQLFTSCLRQGLFPSEWKDSSLVLLRKEGRAADSPSAYRPICLLDEIGKLFKRIVADRIVEHLVLEGPNLSECQFGFRRGQSTVDAILRVRSLSDEAVSEGGVSLAISLDIVNAFNSLPWQAIREALVYHQVPPYLRGIVGAYLQDRHITYMGRDAEVHRRPVYCGVPQGSVLGPLLWNLAYDSVLRADLPAGVHVVCYADDTLVLANGDNFESTTRLAELGVACVTRKIHGLGLQLAPHKTEALWFHNLSRGEEPPDSSIRVGDVQVPIRRQIKYLGLILDGRWDFREHHNRLYPRIEKVIGALHRILPNLGGPREGVRRLYAGVVRSFDGTLRCACLGP